jgi:nitronate monooxygenase
MLTTRFTERFGVDHPIVCAPMGGATDGRLAAAVSGAGALGTVQAAHPRADDDWFAAQLEGAAAPGRPCGARFNTAFLPYFERRFDRAMERAVPVVVLSFGEPAPWIGRAHDGGALVLCQVQTRRAAAEAVGAGADAIAVQGNEAGGHTGTMGLLPLLAAVLDDGHDVPVLAAGGVGSGRTLAGVLAMGADGAIVGTPFLASEEAPAHDPGVKELIVASDGGDTVWTRAYDIVEGLPWPEGIGERVRANAFTARWAGREDELRAQRDEVKASVPPRDRFDPDEGGVLYGQSAAFVHAVRPAARVVADLVAETEAQLARFRG